MGFVAFPEGVFTQQSFLAIVTSHRYRNIKPDAPSEVKLRDVVTTGQVTPSPRILTPSTIHRDDIFSQVTRDNSSLVLSESSSLGSGKSKSRSKEPPFTTQSAAFGLGNANFGRSCHGCTDAEFCN